MSGAGSVATILPLAKAACRALGAGSSVVVVKAQVKIGGRGKAGGVKVAKSADEAASVPVRSSAWTSRGTPCTG